MSAKTTQLFNSATRMIVEVDDAIPGGHRQVAQRAQIVVSSALLTRPADANAYVAGDAVTDSISAPSQLTFAGCGRFNGGSGSVVGATLIDEANQTVKGAFELWIFDTAVTPDNDNAPFARTNAQCLTLVGVISLSTGFVSNTGSGASGNVVYQSGPIDLPFACGAASASLFGLLVVRNGYTPVSAEVFGVRLAVRQD